MTDRRKSRKKKPEVVRISDDRKDKTKTYGVPDKVTRELTIYGSKYRVVKKAFYNIDKMADWLESRNAYLVDEIDADIADSILTECHEALTMPDKDIPKNVFEQVQLLKEYTKNMLALKTLVTWKVEIDVWGRYHGSVEYGKRLQTMGIPEWIWKLSTNMNGSAAIAYATVKEACHA
jgi:hypothetical protein